MLVRYATPADLRHLAGIEQQGDAQLAEWFGVDLGWDPPTPGERRARLPGFLLVADHEGAVVGFAHVLESQGCCHLEQLCVARAHQRRGTGRALVERVLAEAAGRAYDSVSLCTYAEVPWNAPFYETCGFEEAEPAHPFHRRLLETERRMGLDRLGRRVLMVARVTR